MATPLMSTEEKETGNNSIQNLFNCLFVPSGEFNNLTTTLHNLLNIIPNTLLPSGKAAAVHMFVSHTTCDHRLMSLQVKII